MMPMLSTTTRTNSMYDSRLLIPVPGSKTFEQSSPILGDCKSMLASGMPVSVHSKH